MARAPLKEKMMSKMIFVNLPVRDLAASTAFYEAVGGTKNPDIDSIWRCHQM